MIRFIVKRQEYAGVCLNALLTSHYTVDADCPELEAALIRGGRGGGPDGDAFEEHELIAAEVITQKKA